VQAEWELVQAEWELVQAEWELVQAEWELVQAEWELVQAEWVQEKVQEDLELGMVQGVLELDVQEVSQDQLAGLEEERCTEDLCLSHHLYKSEDFPYMDNLPYNTCISMRVYHCHPMVCKPYDKKTICSSSLLFVIY
jgi:hypothetical protein